HADAGTSGESLHPPDQHHGAELAAILAETGSEIRELHRAPAAVVQSGHENRCVDQIFLLCPGAVEQLDRPEAEIGVRGPIAQQGAEEGVPVEAREARPHDLAQRVHQRAERPVPHQGEIERAHGAAPRAPCRSHARMAPTSRSRQRACVRPVPTFTECPRRRLTVVYLYYSVDLSLTYTGVLMCSWSS